MGLSHPLLLPLQIPWQRTGDRICRWRLSAQILGLRSIYTDRCRSSNSGCNKDGLAKSSPTLTRLLPRRQLPPRGITQLGRLSYNCSKAYGASVEMPNTTPHLFFHWQVELTQRRREKRQRKSSLIRSAASTAYRNTFAVTTTKCIRLHLLAGNCYILTFLQWQNWYGEEV